MKKVFAIILLFISLLLFTKLAFAQNATQSALPAISFPIAQLGNCSSAADCKTYCDDPTHLDACIAYAKGKGFYKESSLDSNQAAIVADAQATLGCDSLASCRAYCQDAAHADACSAFAQKHNLKGGQQTVSTTTLQKAEQMLGCNSEDSCKTFCQQDANRQKCADFAKQQGIRGGDETIGPGGCTSESSCKTYCSDPTHFSACSQFMQEKVGSESGHEQFTGPGGCTSEEACRSYCDKNPTACHLNPSGHEAPMSATAAAHIENLSNCKENPEQCRPTGVPSVENSHQGQQLPQQPSGPRPPEGERGTNKGVVPPAPSVQGASTHIDFFQWFIGKLFHTQ